MALEFGGTVLGAKASESDMDKMQKQLAALGEDRAVMRQMLEKNFEKMNREVRDDWEQIKDDFKQKFDEVRLENKAIVEEVNTIKDIVLHSHLMIEDLKYKVSKPY